MKLITESGEVLELDTAAEHYVSVDADSDTTISVTEAEDLLASGKMELAEEATDKVDETAITEAKDDKKITADDDGDDADEDEDEDEEVDEATATEAHDPKATKLKKKKITSDDESEAEVFEDDDKKEIEINVKEDVAAMFHGEELSEDFKSKASTIFESAIKSKVKEQVAIIQEATDTTIAEQVTAVSEDLTNKLDGYLDYMVNEWMEDNKLAVENGIKNDIFEDFIEGMKGLFEDHYVEIPEERYNVIDEQNSEIAELKEQLDTEMNKNMAMQKDLNESVAEGIFNKVTVDMADTQIEKLRSLAEELEFDTAEDYQAKLDTLKESYFPSEEVVAETANVAEAKTVETDDRMKAVLATLSNKTTF